MSKDARGGKKNAKRSQWRLSTLLIMMLGFAIVFAGIAKIHSRVSIEANFQALPKSDIDLRMWLVERYGATKIAIDRPDGQTVAVQFSRPSHSFSVPNPPWDKLGYQRLGSFTFAQSPVLGWWIPIGLIVIFLSGPLSRGFHIVAGKRDRNPVRRDLR